MVPRLPPALRAAALVLAALAVALVACRGDGLRTDDDGRVRVMLWHSMVSPLDGSLNRIVTEFNESQSQYRVEAIFQGAYNESLNKLIASLGARNIPALIQLDDVSTQIMIDSSEITPVQDFIDAEGYDLSDFDPKALGYYQQDGVLYAMPFNLAGPILYYDRQAFSEAGLDPDRPPRTLQEVREYSERLVVHDENGEVTRSGIALQISPWLFEQMIAKQGGLYVNNGNGRDGRATEVRFDGPEGRAIIE